MKIKYLKVVAYLNGEVIFETKAKTLSTAVASLNAAVKAAKKRGEPAPEPDTIKIYKEEREIEL